MAKRYTRINWQNAPSAATPRTAENFNIMDKGIKDCDDAIGDLALLKTTAKADLVAAINEQNDNLVSNVVGTVVDIKSYTDTFYTFHSDGYVTLGGYAVSQSTYIYGLLHDANSNVCAYLGCSGNGSVAGYNAIYVKKGMKWKIAEIGGSSFANYYPLIY